MQKQDITFKIADDGCRMYAICQERTIGSIFFVRVGIDKIMISDAQVEPDYKNDNIELYLTEEVIKIARTQHRKIVSICPYISKIFNQHPEFDDVRLLNRGR